jgi:hypothetical protein
MKAVMTNSLISAIRAIIGTVVLGAALSACSQPAAAPKSGPVADTTTVNTSAAAPRSIAARTGPFGLQMGMTEAELRTAVPGIEPGKEPAMLVARSVPKAHSAFDSYLFTLTKSTGLCKVTGVGVDIEMNSFGSQINSAFKSIEEALVEKYGAVADRYDYLQSGSIWNEPEDWAMALYKEERRLASVWTFSPARTEDGLQAILLKASALSPSKGYVSLFYEFSNFDQCLKERNKATNAAF